MFKVFGIIGISKVAFFNIYSTERVKQMIAKYIRSIFLSNKNKFLDTHSNNLEIDSFLKKNLKI